MADNSKTMNRPSPAKNGDFDFFDFWSRYRMKIILGAGVIVVAVLAFFVWRHMKHARIIAAEEKFQESPVENYGKIADEYAGTPAAARALYLTAVNDFDNGRYDDAVAHYQRFINEYPKHAATEAAHYGVASALEAKGDHAGAIEAYNTMLEKFPTDFPAIGLAGEARLGIGRCQEALGQWKEARKTYDELILMGKANARTPEEAPITYHKASERRTVVARQINAQIPATPGSTSSGTTMLQPGGTASGGTLATPTNSGVVNPGSTVTNPVTMTVAPKNPTPATPVTPPQPTSVIPPVPSAGTTTPKNPGTATTPPKPTAFTPSNPATKTSPSGGVNFSTHGTSTDSGTASPKR